MIENQMPHQKRSRVTAIIAVLCTLALSEEVHAKLNKKLYQAPEALAMGEAVTAFIDDHNALWYNPAGAAAFDSFEWRMLAFDLGGTKDIYDSINSLSKLQNPSSSTASEFMGKRLFGQVTSQTSFIFPQLGIAGLYDVQAGFAPQNQIFPNIEYGYQRTGGVQASFGFSSKDGFRRRGKRKKETQSEWRFGLGAKYFVRRGGFQELTVAQLFNFNKENVMDVLSKEGSSYGADLGVQRIERISDRMTLSAGASYMNIGDMTFGGNGSPVRAALNTGVAAQWDLGIPKFTAAFDVHQLTTNADFRQKINVGARLKLPLLTFYFGLSHLRPTFGAAVDLWLIRVSAASFEEELGEIYGSVSKRRYVARFELKLEF
jgi:hypothetical protein